MYARVKMYILVIMYTRVMWRVQAGERLRLSMSCL